MDLTGELFAKLPKPQKQARASDTTTNLASHRSSLHPHEMKQWAFGSVLVSLLTVITYAHSGGLDSNGGHNDRKNGGYHYHRSPPAAVPKQQEAETKNSAIQKEQSYWITSSSSVRHNSKCRYFKNSKGRPCTKDEGRPCKICGG